MSGNLSLKDKTILLRVKSTMKDLSTELLLEIKKLVDNECKRRVQ
jgi:hypothetical protein